MNPLYIFSSAGFGREAYGSAIRAGFKVKAFVEKNVSSSFEYCGIPIIDENDVGRKYPEPEAAVVAVGDPFLREKIVNKIIKTFPNCEFPNIIDPSCILLNLETIKLGHGIVMMPFCLLTTDITIGDFCQFGVGTGLGHDCAFEEYVTTGMNPNFAGYTKIGKMTRVGSNVTTIDHISICENVMIGAGSLVIKNIIEPGTYIGSPAKKLVKEIW